MVLLFVVYVVFGELLSYLFVVFFICYVENGISICFKIGIMCDWLYDEFFVIIFK